MNARLMGKGVRPNNRLVGLHHHAGEVGHQPRGFGELLGADGRQRRGAVFRTAHEGIEVAAAHMHRHHQLF